MKAAVLMSTYNGARFIREQLDSILDQTGEFELDLWVRDDGSTDGTKDILNDYESRGLLRWYTGENLGPAQSFLDLVRRTLGYDWYAFADQDDFWMPEKLSWALETLEEIDAARENAALYFSNAELVDEALSPLGRCVYKSTPRTDFRTVTCAGGCLGCTMVFNNALARMIQEKAAPDRVVMHDFYAVELCGAMGGRVVFDPRCSMKYRQHGGNTIGVPHGLWGTLVERLRSVSNAGATGIAEQARSLLTLYGSELKEDDRAWLEKVAGYKRSLFSRAGLALSCKTRYMNKNMSATIRCAIFLGTR